MPALLEINGLAKIYQNEEVETRALDGVSLTVAKGEFIAIMGASGSGKTTLLNILGLLDRPTGGTYIFDGQDTAQLSDVELARIRNGKIGFVFQAFHLLARTTVLENTLLPLQYSNIPRSEHLKRAQEALLKVGLLNRLNHKPSQLSGGEKQRTAIARALVNQPQLLLADEPTGNLDSKTGEVVMQLIDALHQQGLTVIVITHETPTANYAQRIIRLSDGQVTTDQKITNQHHHFTK